MLGRYGGDSPTPLHSSGSNLSLHQDLLQEHLRTCQEEVNLTRAELSNTRRLYEDSVDLQKTHFSLLDDCSQTLYACRVAHNATRLRLAQDSSEKMRRLLEEKDSLENKLKDCRGSAEEGSRPVDDEPPQTDHGYDAGAKKDEVCVPLDYALYLHGFYFFSLVVCFILGGGIRKLC